MNENINWPIKAIPDPGNVSRGNKNALLFNEGTEKSHQKYWEKKTRINFK
jgi:hypothetical protein